MEIHKLLTDNFDIDNFGNGGSCNLLWTETFIYTRIWELCIPNYQTIRILYILRVNYK